MLSHHHFGGNFTLDKSYLESHLTYEWAKNQVSCLTNDASVFGNGDLY